MIDALPYIDRHYEQIRSRVDALINAELANDQVNGKIHPSVEERFPLSPPSIKRSPLLDNEWERISLSKKSPILDMSRYQVNAPSHKASLEEWQESVKKSQTALEHQKIRSVNLELLNKFGTDAWALAQYQSEQTLTHLTD